MSRPWSLSVIIPAFNEAETIGGIVRNVRRLDEAEEILVVDDGSTVACRFADAGLDGAAVFASLSSNGDVPDDPAAVRRLGARYGPVAQVVRAHA